MTGIIAIDGPAASGKSTVARRVASALDALYVDSGAVYRGITWAALERGVDVHDEAAVTEMRKTLRVRFAASEGAVVFTIDGEAPGDAIRSHAVNHAVSPIAAMPSVRIQVVNWLREMVALGPLVMEGRDIGTAVFPDCPYKFYLDASPEERARRRHREMAEGEASLDEAAVGASLKRRDQIDSSRKMDPLKVAADAHRIDSTGMSADDVVAMVLAVVRPTDA